MPARPGHPGRPDHPDFEPLAAAVRHIDALADEQVPPPDIVGEFTDWDTAVYVAMQRALRITPPGVSPSEMSRTATAWLDGMIAGYRLREAHERKST